MNARWNVGKLYAFSPGVVGAAGDSVYLFTDFQAFNESQGSGQHALKVDGGSGLRCLRELVMTAQRHALEQSSEEALAADPMTTLSECAETLIDVVSSVPDCVHEEGRTGGLKKVRTIKDTARKIIEACERLENNPWFC